MKEDVTEDYQEQQQGKNSNLLLTKLSGYNVLASNESSDYFFNLALLD